MIKKEIETDVESKVEEIGYREMRLSGPAEWKKLLSIRPRRLWLMNFSEMLQARSINTVLLRAYARGKNRVE